MMHRIPNACINYPERFEVAIDGLTIEQSAEQRFTLHPNSCYAKIQNFIENWLFYPFSRCLQAYSHGCPTIFGSVTPTPFPGRAGQFSENDKSKKICKERVVCIVLSPLAVISCGLGMCARIACIKTRPFLQVIRSKKWVPLAPPALTFDHPSRFATINLAYPPNCARIAQDVTPSKERARLMATSILNDPYAADFYCLQEDWDRSAMEEFSTIVSEKYIVVHSVGPSIGGMSASCAFLSRYPLIEVRFQKLRHMVKGHSLPPRGFLSATIATQAGLLTIYNFHLQSNDGELEARARTKQFEDLGKIMMSDAKQRPGLLQIAMGDGNSPPVDMWGRNNDNQMERQALDMLDKVLYQPFYEDHDRVTGERTTGLPEFLFMDNLRMIYGEQVVSQLDFSYLPFSSRILACVLSFAFPWFYPEPTASWYLGPFYEPKDSADHPIPKELEDPLVQDRVKHRYPPPKKVGQKAIRAKTWGTEAWFEDQPLETAMFDIIGVPHTSLLKARVEIRRHITDKKTGPLADHACVQGTFWLDRRKPKNLQFSREV